MKFAPGQLVATRGAAEAFAASGESPYAYLLRHVAGDYGSGQVGNYVLAAGRILF